MNENPLYTTLIDLDRATRRADFKLILCGGFGLYLKQIQMQKSAERSLLPGELWPAPRATEDLDVLLPTEFLVSLAHMRELRSALDKLQFVPVAEAKYLHFVKSLPEGGRVKVDLLTGPITDAASKAKLRITPPRVRPRGQLELHAYLTEEAIDFQLSLYPVIVEGVGSDGVAGKATVHIPQSFTMLLMKLHAFADRVQDQNKDLGRHHAIDVYRVVAMLTEDEYKLVRRQIETHSASKPVVRARQIVGEYFSSPPNLGLLRLREHPLFSERMDVQRLVSALADLFQ